MSGDRIVLGQLPLRQVLLRVAELVVATIPGAGEISVTLVEERLHRTAFTGSLAAALDERRCTAGFAPCVDDTAQAPSSVDCAASAAQQGVRSLLSIGLPMLQLVRQGGEEVPAAGPSRRMPGCPPA